MRTCNHLVGPTPLYSHNHAWFLLAKNWEKPWKNHKDDPCAYTITTTLILFTISSPPNSVNILTVSSVVPTSSGSTGIRIVCVSSFWIVKQTGAVSSPAPALVQRFSGGRMTFRHAYTLQSMSSCVPTSWRNIYPLFKGVVVVCSAGNGDLFLTFESVRQMALNKEWFKNTQWDWLGYAEACGAALSQTIDRPLSDRVRNSNVLGDWSKVSITTKHQLSWSKIDSKMTNI